jgi:hypothetical protein
VTTTKEDGLTTEIPFEEFPKIPRLRRDCIITEKLDGTNAQIVVPEDGGPLLAGSRNRWIAPGKLTDNHGFAAWVAEHEDELRTLGPGRHFGEWWGAGIQRRYGLTEKRFSLFNTTRWTEQPTPMCVSVVPVLYAGPFSDAAVNDALARLFDGGSVAAPGFMQPEGIVVFLSASRQLYKVTLGNDGHKEARAS